MCSVASLSSLGTIFYLLGKFGATAAFGTTYVPLHQRALSNRVVPTVMYLLIPPFARVRNACVGISSMFGRVGAILSPYVARCQQTLREKMR